MSKKFSIAFLVTAVFATVALMSYGQARAKPPCEEERVFDQRIYVKFKPDCEEVIWVKFCDTWDGNGDCTNWVPSQQKTKGVLCSCEGSGCVDDLQTNIDNMSDPDVTVECWEVRDTGPLSGCPIYLNPEVRQEIQHIMQ